MPAKGVPFRPDLLYNCIVITIRPPLYVDLITFYRRLSIRVGRHTATKTCDFGTSRLRSACACVRARVSRE